MDSIGVSIGEMLSTPVLLASTCHQCIRFESQLGLEFSGFSMWHFLKLVVRGSL